jgi:hypothetical protein
MTDPTIRAGETPGPKTPEVRPLADDILRGAEEIAAFLFGSTRQRRKVYHLAETSRMPCFRLGAVLCARRSTLLGWIEEQEARSINGQQ